MKFPKILVTTYSTAFLSAGGGEFEIIDFIHMMKSLNFQIDLYGLDSKKVDFYNCAFHYSIHPYGEHIFAELIKNNLKVFLWPNVWFVTKPEDCEKSRISFFLNASNKILFKSNVELLNFCNFFPEFREKCTVIPITLPKLYLNNEINNEARLISNFKNYIVSIGRIEPIKNQLMLIRACNELNLNCIFVGGYSDPNYFKECVAISKNNIQFSPPIKPQSNLLLSLISLSQGSAEISFDPPGRSAIEVAALKKPLLQSHKEWADEYFSSFSYVCTPNDLLSVCKNLEIMLNDSKHCVDASFSIIKNNFILNNGENNFHTNISELFLDV